jgi:integrase
VGVAEGKAVLGDEALVSALVDDYLKQPLALRPKSRRSLEGFLKTIRVRLGDLKVTSPRFRAAVKEYRAQRVAEGRAVRTVNGEVGALHQIIVWALDVYPGLSDPLAGLRRLTPPHTEARALTLDEVRKLLAVLQTPEERLRVGLYLYTGMRLNEGSQLWWSHVDLAAGVITVEPHEGFTPKNGEARLVPICSELDRILREAPRRGLHVLTTRGGQPFQADGGNPFTRWLKKVYNRAGIVKSPRLGCHTLRHTYCSHLARQNVRAELRAKLVGHRSLAMQSVYTHSFQDDALAAGKKVCYA